MIVTSILGKCRGSDGTVETVPESGVLVAGLVRSAWSLALFFEASRVMGNSWRIVQTKFCSLVAVLLGVRSFADFILEIRVAEKVGNGVAVVIFQVVPTERGLDSVTVAQFNVSCISGALHCKLYRPSKVQFFKERSSFSLPHLETPKNLFKTLP